VLDTLLIRALFILFFLWQSFAVLGAEDQSKTENLFAKGITVDLREPEYCEGVLKTEKGGVVQASNMRLQARHIVYTRKVIDEKPVLTIEAEGDLLLEFGEYTFVGRRLEFDFQTKTGIIYDGRTGIEPWYFGGQTIYLLEDGSYYIEEAFVTTSENYKMDWKITARETTLVDNRFLDARHVNFIIANRRVFWLPKFQTDLETIFDSPIRYSFRWSGRQGPRASMIYEVFSWRRLKTFFRLDWRFNRGLGVGIETYLRSKDRKEELQTINYIAQDSALIHPKEQIRYRYQGLYNNLLDEDHLSIQLSWDKLSDREMATDYKDKGLELDTAGRTQLHIREYEDSTITNFFTRVRINPFQTIKQELPTLETHILPRILLQTGIISDTHAKASYLDYQYSSSVAHGHDYHSTRMEYEQNLYRPFNLGWLTFTPNVGGLAIFYGNSPESKSRWLLQGQLGCEANTRIYRHYNGIKHVIIPYVDYTYYTFPTTNPHDHYIFDIEDGWYRWDMLTFGFAQNVYIKNADGTPTRLLFADLHANAFFDTPTIPQTIPKVYALFVFNPLPFLRHSFDTAWDFEEHQLDHLNIRCDWTVSADFAIAVEYRHRDSFDWRKADHTNFILDSFRTIEELRHSQLSDRRDTLLTHFYYRINPSFAVEFQSRQGWNRRHQPKYSEFEIDFLATLRSAWNLRLSYRYREEEKFRLSFNFSVGINRPDYEDCETIVPCLEF
jgi:hypothetical protein